MVAQMVFMIFFKWIAYSATGVDAYSPKCAPSILNLFIDMMLFQDPEKEGGHKTCELPDCVKETCSKFMFSGQKELQFALITIGMLCIPVMLLGKPLYIMLKQRSYHGVIKNGNQRTIQI